MSSKTSSFESLPAEIIDQIVTHLPPLSLVSLSRTSRLFRYHSQNDLLWAKFVQESVPNWRRWQSPLACDSWKELYISHHPYWFLPRCKIWVSDKSNTGNSNAGNSMTGQVIIARYDPRRGCIEAYRLVAERVDPHLVPWELDSEVIIYTFNPKVSLWLDDPVIKLDLGSHRGGNGPQREVLMQIGGAFNIRSAIALGQAIPVPLQNPSMSLWPPAVIPAPQRAHNKSQSMFRGSGHRPRPLADASHSTFQLRKWLEIRGRGMARVGEDVMTFSTILEESYTPTKQKPWQGIWVGDYSGHGCEFLLVIQKDVDCVQPITASRWSSQSSLITLASAESVNGTSDVAASEVPLPTIETTVNDGDATVEDEPPEDGSCWGKLEAIKLTGDPNVPRGEYTWIAEDIGPKGLLRIAHEQMFKGARVVRSLGHTAAREFRNGKWHSGIRKDMRQDVLTYDRSFQSVTTDHDLS